MTEVFCIKSSQEHKKRVVFVAFITLKNGRRIYAKQYGKKAFRFFVD